MSHSIRLRLTLPRAQFDVRADVTLPQRGITVLFGASGSGKTSILRGVAGLERALDGLVRIGEHVWQDESAGLFMPTWQRPLGYVFQEASLFEHLDVLANLRYGMKRTRTSGAVQALEAFDSAIDLLGIANLLDATPSQLSGGERQRVAIARALATQPRLLLLDEPLASIDQARRQEILPWLERLRDELSVPMLYVTHSVDELARLADHVVLLERGVVRASGLVTDVMTAADTPFVAGEDAGALLHGSVVERDAQWQLVRVAFDGGSLWLRDAGLPVGKQVRLRVLARDVSLATEEPHSTSILNQLACCIDAIDADHHPSQTMVRVRVGGSLLLARITRRSCEALRLHPGQAVWAQVKAAALVQ